MKSTHKIFFAIPFDAATRNLYERVSDSIRKRYPETATVIGNQEVGPSPTYSDIETFKSQNRELSRQFVTQIQDADIVVADLTNNNANVHVELGIALLENKNIIRVTGRSVSELGFDIRNLEVHAYKSEADLQEKLNKYLDTFFKIKQLPISTQHGKLYYSEPNPINLFAFPDGFDFKPLNCPNDYQLRDGAINVKFEILRSQSENDWFGVLFRAASSPLLGSHMLYARANGALEVALYPGPKILNVFQAGRAFTGVQSLELEFENNNLTVRTGSSQFQTDLLSHQAPGRVWVAAWKAEVRVDSVESICRDTIRWE